MQEILMEIFDKINCGVAVYDSPDQGKSFHFKYINKSVETIEHINSKNIIGKNVVEIFPGIEEFGLLDIFKEVYQTGKTAVFSSQYYKDKRISGWRDNYVFRLRTNEIVAVCVDSTPKKEAEELLREKQAFLENITDIAYITNANGEVQYANPAAEQITGYTVKELLGKPFLPLFIESDHVPVMDVYQRTLKGEKLENILTFTSGRTCHFTSLPYLNNEGQIIGTFGIARDITEQKRIETALKESESFFQQMFQQSKTSTQLYTPDGICVKVNPEFCKLFGVSADVITDGRYNVFKDQAAIDAGIIPLIKELVTHKKTNKWQIHFDIAVASVSTDTESSRMEKVWIDVLGYPILDINGNVQYFVLQHYDVTEQKNNEIALKKAKEEAEKANRSKSEFLSKMSHELRNTLNGSMLILQKLLQEKNSFSDLQTLSLQNIKTSSDVLLTYIENLLEIKKIEEGKIDVEPEEVTVETLFDENISILTNLANEKNITISLHKKNLSGNVNIDKVKINQVLTNFIVNSIKYTSPGGNIAIHIELREDTSKATQNYTLFLSVTDDGIGIASENLDRIFDNFVQIRDQKTSDVSGLGLGLAISREIIGKMGGKIWAESKGLSQGSIFYVSLPVTLVQNASKPGPVLRQGNAETFLNKKVLLVEDDAINAWALETTLKGKGFRVEKAYNGLEALEKFTTQEFDLLLMDMQMPGMCGEEAMKKIRQIENTDGKHIPIIACTGKAYENQIHEIFDSGADDYISKPIDENELLHKIYVLLK